LSLGEEIKREQSRLQRHSALATLWQSIRILMSMLLFASPWLPSCEVSPSSKHHQREAQRQHLWHFLLWSICILQL